MVTDPANLSGDPGPMQLLKGSPDERPDGRNAPVPGSYLTFSMDVYVDGLDDEDIIDRLVGITEAQANHFRSVIAAELGSTGASVQLGYIGDPHHPVDRECVCVGPPGWHCPGEESEHWAKYPQDPGSECGHCGV